MSEHLFENYLKLNPFSPSHYLENSYWAIYGYWLVAPQRRPLVAHPTFLQL